MSLRKIALPQTVGNKVGSAGWNVHISLSVEDESVNDGGYERGK